MRRPCGVKLTPGGLRARNLITDTLYSYDSPSVPDTTDPWLGSTAATYEMQLPEVGDYDVQVYVTDSTLTTPNRWSTWIGKVVHTLGPSENTIAAGTGPEKATIYWAGVPNAVGYNLYRAAASGGELVKVNGSLITSLDPGPGLTNAYRYTDTGRSTDEEVFYRVTAVDAQGVERIYGEEARATPATNSIPWDSDDPAAITAACTEVTNAAIYQTFGQPIAAVVAQGPNGVIYESHVDASPATASPTPAVVDTDHGAIVHNEPNPDGQLQPICMENGLVDGTPGSFTYRPTNPPSGVFRKVETIPGRYKLHTKIWLPATGPPNVLLNKGEDPEEGSLDMAYIYTGGYAYRPSMRSKGEELDAGFQLGHTGNRGWKMLIAQSTRDTKKNKRKPVTVPSPWYTWWVGPGEVEFAFVASGAGSPVSSSNCLLSTYVHQETTAGITGPHLVALYRHLSGWARNDTTALKRVNSMAQKLSIPGDKQRGYANSHAYVRGAAWGNPSEEPYGVKLTPGGLWDEDLTRRYDATTYCEGSFPARGPVINWLIQNAYFWETHININLPSQ